MITPSSTNPEVTVSRDGKVRPFVFRVCFIDPFQGTVMAKFAHGRGIERVAVLRDIKNAYSVGLADFFLSKFKELGGRIVDDQSYKAGDPDFKAQLTAIKGKNPQAIYVPGYYTDVALIARQARELGMKQPLMGGDGWDSAKLYEIGGKALDGSFFSNHYSPDDPSPRIQEFISKFKARFGAVPDSMAATGYDAAMVAADAIGRAKDVSGESIAQAIAATKDFPGVTGVITLDQDHNAVKPAVVLEVKGGKAVYVATVAPDAPAGGAAPVPASQPAR
jgi:branched-chain amino acid transport system substrate-binding protein